jgi:hypothetical protein
MMKNKTIIEEALDKVQESECNHFGMTYEQGVEEALMWVLGEIDDEDFSFTPKKYLK